MLSHTHNAWLDFFLFGYRPRGLGLASRIQESYLNSLHNFSCAVISYCVVICDDDTSENKAFSSGSKPVPISYWGIF